MSSDMKIYFCGSIRGGREDAAIYLKIVNHLKTYGHVLNEIVADQTLTKEDRMPPDGEVGVHDRDMLWFHQSDVLVAEVTQPSLGVGYELGRAFENNKLSLVLFQVDNARGQKLSAMIRGAPSNAGKFHVYDYTENNVLQIIDSFMNNIKRKQ